MSRRKGPGERRTGGVRDEHGTVRLSTALVVIVAGLLVPLDVAPSWASWTDDGSVNGTVVSTYTVPAVSFTGCTPAGNNSTRTVTFSFAGISTPAVTYVSDVSDEITTSSESFLNTPVTQFRVSYNPGNPNRNKTVTVQVYRRLSAAANWAGPMDTATFTTAGNNGNATCNSW